MAPRDAGAWRRCRPPETKTFFSLPDARPPCRGWEAYAFMPRGMEVTRSLAPSLAKSLMDSDAVRRIDRVGLRR